MDWRSINFDWNRARAFLVTAEEGSLSAAAKSLKMTQPTLGRQVSALESELGVALFERVGRKLELTGSGRELVDYVRTMAEAASALSLAATGRSEAIEGCVCITASELMTAYLLPPIVHKLQQTLPGITCKLLASNDERDLKKREADIAIRAFRPTQPDLIARKLREVNGRLYATPSYLEQYGDPSLPGQLEHAKFINFDDDNTLARLLSVRGFEINPQNFTTISDNRIVQWQLVKSGVGIGLMPEPIGDADPSVCRVMDEIEPFVAELWLVSHRELKTNRLIRKVFDFLVEELSV